MTYIIIPVTPVAQPRQRHAVVAGKLRNYTPTSSPVNVFKATVRLTWQQFCGDVAPLDVPVYVSADFVLPLPKSKHKKMHSGHRQWCAVKPDIDNLYKALADCLTGLAYHDDKQVVSVRLTKSYAADCEQAKVELTVLPAGDMCTRIIT